MYVHRSANIQFMFMFTNNTRKEWVLKTCGSLVARQPWRSALEDLELSPIILKASIKLVWTHWCRLAVQCVAETDDRKAFDIIHPSFSMSVNTCVISLPMKIKLLRITGGEIQQLAKFSIRISKGYVELHVLGWKPRHVCFLSECPSYVSTLINDSWLLDY